MTSIYIGGGTPTLALDGVAAHAWSACASRFRVTGDVCIETNPADVDDDAGRPSPRGRRDPRVARRASRSPRATCATIGRRYTPGSPSGRCDRLAGGGFAAVNADLMFALPGQTAADVVADLDTRGRPRRGPGHHLSRCSRSRTRPSAEYLRLRGVAHAGPGRGTGALPRDRGTGPRAAASSASPCGASAAARAPRYSSVTRDGYIGIGPGAGSHLPDGFVLNTFDLDRVERRAASPGAARSPCACRSSAQMAGWWWLYWRIYDTRIPTDRPGPRCWAGTRPRHGAGCGRSRPPPWCAAATAFWELTDEGAFWLHLAAEPLRPRLRGPPVDRRTPAAVAATGPDLIVTRAGRAANVTSWVHADRGHFLTRCW